jgi:adenosylmethionine-8-amino-7-oxononanoate aminotransferase
VLLGAAGGGTAGSPAAGSPAAGSPAAGSPAGGSPPATQASYPDGWQAQVRRIETGLRAGLAPVTGLPAVTDVRVLGAIGVVQVDHEVDMAAATAAAVRAGVWLRPFRDLIYTMPPYVTSDDDLALICAGILEVARC